MTKAYTVLVVCFPAFLCICEIDESLRAGDIVIAGPGVNDVIFIDWSKRERAFSRFTMTWRVVSRVRSSTFGRPLDPYRNLNAQSGSEIIPVWFKRDRFFLESSSRAPLRIGDVTDVDSAVFLRNHDPEWISFAELLDSRLANANTTNGRQPYVIVMDNSQEIHFWREVGVDYPRAIISPTGTIYASFSNESSLASRPFWTIHYGLIEAIKMAFRPSLLVGLSAVTPTGEPRIQTVTFDGRSSILLEEPYEANGNTFVRRCWLDPKHEHLPLRCQFMLEKGDLLGQFDIHYATKNGSQWIPEAITVVQFADNDDYKNTRSTDVHDAMTVHCEMCEVSSVGRQQNSTWSLPPRTWVDDRRNHSQFFVRPDGSWQLLAGMTYLELRKDIPLSVRRGGANGRVDSPGIYYLRLFFVVSVAAFACVMVIVSFARRVSCSRQ